ncbi:MAG TPA: DUF4139 domain-containing protein [Bacteroidia bacterium]|jgi:uncharacterized protein (TIGR02231 family)|nr:DUF4139 domain-containing protein [Bacteroidota bacterium]MBK8585639.1 DUF4139 domain-containing protein [Bacteroidota bacterium]MBP6657038.1 DUF4139 domain-containing protein [Bacteroidia bacterium]MBP9923408.1 DUF4139 domain-containing protein [Bacteroidia bacterium]HQW23070.1 DUF4139 domain-containing protein [Bacteroidia bacterium]
MKNFILPAMLFIALSASAVNEKIVKSAVKNVTVFTQGAQVFRSSSVSLSTGVTDLVFQGISPFINPTSVQAGGKGDFVVLEVRHQIKYPEPTKPADGTLPKEVVKEIKFLEDSLIEIGFDRDELADRKVALQMEKDMIMKNKLSNGEGKSDSLPILKQAMEFFRLKLTDINIQLNKIKRDEQRNANATNLVNARLSDLRKYKNSEEPQKVYAPIHQVIVTVSADAPVTCTVDVSYMIANAGWVPSYDLRSTTAAAPVQLTYKANVFQTSGEDWDNVKLKLSTSNPNRSNIKPALPPWYINYYTAQRETKIPTGARSTSTGNTSISDVELDAIKKDMNEMTPAQSAANYSQLVETMANVMFEISLPYSIPSDGATHIVSVKTSNLPATYYHYLVPKIESEAFLLAKVTGWEELNLLPGSANVFYEGTFVGETVLNPAVINDTLDLAFGRDNGITVTRTKLPVKESNKLIGNDITKTITYELRMKNNKSKALNLVVEDQIPLSQNQGIKVEMKDAGKADYNTQTGLLKWNLSVNSKEYKTLKFSYEVTYNKDMPLSMY